MVKLPCLSSKLTFLHSRTASSQKLVVAFLAPPKLQVHPFAVAIHCQGLTPQARL
jgi:hypothetical protein